jgi:tetratricopeptide (TPR) repeat protein
VLTQGRFLAARPFFERAIALDPNFASVYYYLSLSFNNAGDTAQEAVYKRKALALIDRVSEFEREQIAGGYYESTGELDKAIDVYRLGMTNYPRWWGFSNFASENYINLGQLEEGLKQGQASNKLQPDAEPPYRRLLDADMSLDRLDEAKQVAERLRTLGIGGARIHQRFLEMAYIESDQAAAAREIQWYAGKPEEYLSFGLQAAYRNVFGQRRESDKLYKRVAETALRQDLGDVGAGFEEADARADALSGNCGTARHLRRPALALALCGDAAGAEKLAAETSKRLPNGTIWNAVQLPEIRAAIELQRGRPARVVELLACASPYERAYPEAVYLRGMAYLRLRKGPEAAAEFQKILDHKGTSWASTWRFPNWGLYYSISYVGLARASVLAGDTARARKAFQDFFALWKDADQNLPILIEAKKDYAALH